MASGQSGSHRPRSVKPSRADRRDLRRIREVGAAVRLSALDTGVLFVSLLAALVLYGLRRHGRVASTPGQGLFDMLGFWTTIELLLISAASLQQDLFTGIGVKLPEPAEIIKNNGPLVPIALVYSAILVARSSFVASIVTFTSEEKDRPK